MTKKPCVVLVRTFPSFSPGITFCAGAFLSICAALSQSRYTYIHKFAVPEPPLPGFDLTSHCLASKRHTQPRVRGPVGIRGRPKSDLPEISRWREADGRSLILFPSWPAAGDLRGSANLEWAYIPEGILNRILLKLIYIHYTLLWIESCLACLLAGVCQIAYSGTLNNNT